MKVTLVLSSEPYADEEFHYESDEELLAAAARLLASTK